MAMKSIPRLFLIIMSLLLAACGAPKPDPLKPDSAAQKPKAAEKVVIQPDQQAIVKSNAKTLAAYQLEVATHISRMNAAKIYATNPQALLRSVIVLRFTVNAQGQLVNKAIVRSNKDRETETTALASLVNAQPYPLPPPHLLKQAKIDLVETWLFNTDGRFQLRTIALPQASQ